MDLLLNLPGKLTRSHYHDGSSAGCLASPHLCYFFNAFFYDDYLTRGISRGGRVSILVHLEERGADQDSRFYVARLLERILTLDNLRRRGLVVPNWCVLCERDVEPVSHIFLSCPFSRKVWEFFSSTLSISGPLHSDKYGVIRSWKAMNGFDRFQKVMEVLLHAFCWFIWLERNSRVFRDESKSEVQVAHKVAFAIGSWMKAVDMFAVQQLRNWSVLCCFSREPD
ncbi:hypothetical protein LINGRAHAP2_LOCUS17349 [Linum grandiflorum]